MGNGQVCRAGKVGDAQAGGELLAHQFDDAGDTLNGRMRRRLRSGGAVEEQAGEQMPRGGAGQEQRRGRLAMEEGGENLLEKADRHEVVAGVDDVRRWRRRMGRLGRGRLWLRRGRRGRSAQRGCHEAAAERGFDGGAAEVHPVDGPCGGIEGAVEVVSVRGQEDQRPGRDGKPRLVELCEAATVSAVDDDVFVDAGRSVDVVVSGVGEMSDRCDGKTAGGRLTKRAGDDAFGQDDHPLVGEAVHQPG